MNTEKAKNVDKSYLRTHFTVHVPSSDLPAFQMRLRDAIKAGGSREKVVGSARISNSTFSRFQAGEPIKRVTAQAIAQALNVDLEWLLTGKDSPPASAAAEEPQAEAAPSIGHNQPPPDPATGSPGLASAVNFQKLGVAIELSVAAYGKAGPIKDWGSVAISTAMFYDNLTAPGADADALIAKVRKSVSGG